MKIQLWREILDPYALAVDELVVKFNHIIEEYRNAGVYSPIEQVTGRVKTISSILEKAHKKNIPLDDIEKEIDDIAGIRIICQFVEDIYKVVDIIRQRSDMIIKCENDYIKDRKRVVIAPIILLFIMMWKHLKEQEGFRLRYRLELLP